MKDRSKLRVKQELKFLLNSNKKIEMMGGKLA